MSTSPGAVDRIRSLEDLESVATRELKTSLSPNFMLSSAALMQSFSLIIGTIPAPRSSSSKSRIALWRARTSRSSRVSSIWATHTPKGANSSPQVCIKMPCPTAAHICTELVFLGRDFSPSLPMPSPTAPELTSIGFQPPLSASATWAHIAPMRAVSSSPIPRVRTPVPSFMTILLSRVPAISGPPRGAPRPLRGVRFS